TPFVRRRHPDLHGRCRRPGGNSRGGGRPARRRHRQLPAFPRGDLVKLLYFAWLREKAGVGEETVDPPAGVATVADLLDWLQARGGSFGEALADRRVVRVAVNQEYVSL